MTDAIQNKQGPARLYYDFRVTLMIFMALTNYFRKVFMDFLSSAFICYSFCRPMNWYLQSKMQLDFAKV